MEDESAKAPLEHESRGDVLTNGEITADWGLHLIDMHVAMGNLIDVVKAKAAAHKR